MFGILFVCYKQVTRCLCDDTTNDQREKQTTTTKNTPGICYHKDEKGPHEAEQHFVELNNNRKIHLIQHTIFLFIRRATVLRFRHLWYMSCALVRSIFSTGGADPLIFYFILFFNTPQ